MRRFKTGATRDTDAGKLDFEGALSPLVLEEFVRYMHAKRNQPGGLRSSDNWKLGIPKGEYMKSAFRHFMTWWKLHCGIKCKETQEEAICALLFNAMGYLHELLKKNTLPPL